MAEFDDPEALKQGQFDLNSEIEEWLEALQKADQMFYNLMTVEIWSIAQTMDELNPGFWAHYMRNRQAIVQQQIEERQSLDPRPDADPLIRKPAPRRASPFDPTLKRKLLDEAATERVSLFSQELEQALPIVRQSVRPEPASPLEPEEELSLAVTDLPRSVATDGTVLDHSSELTDLEQDVEEIHIIEPTVPPPPPAKPSLTAGILIELPHLMRVPLVKFLPPTESVPQGCLSVSIACWLTRYFLIPLADQPGFSLKRQQTLTLAPGQSIVCRLGFAVVEVVSPVRVTLAKPLKTPPGLIATWISGPGPVLEVPDTTSSEVSVQLTNQGNQPYHLQAGQPFCTLDLTCRSDAASPVPGRSSSQLIS